MKLGLSSQFTHKYPQVILIAVYRADRLTSRFWHSCAELVGSPIQRISFFSLLMMFMAMRTLSASYTRRRMFFWSYCCSEAIIRHSIRGAHEYTYSASTMTSDAFDENDQGSYYI